MRTGKIALLPKTVRDQLNRRLDNHELGPALLAWLNNLPEVRHLVDTQFDGVPINKQNLSRWRTGGFREWQTRQDAFQNLPDVMSEMKALRTAEGEPVSEPLSTWLAVHCFMTARATLADDQGVDRLNLLRTLCADVTDLRRGDHRAGRLKLDNQRWAWNLRRGSKELEIMNALDDWSKHPNVVDCVRDPSLTTDEKRRRLFEMLGVSSGPTVEPSANTEPVEQ